MGSCPLCQNSFSDELQFCPTDGSKLSTNLHTSPLIPNLSSSPEPGWVIDEKYTLEEKLGEGGMGSVWRARHNFMDKPLALKLLRSEVTDSEEAVKRFALEAKLASQLDNPHCTMVYDCGRDRKSGTLYLAMEYLEGQSLRALLDRERRLPIPRATDIFCQLLNALGAAHSQGIVHRDVKPENVFLLQRKEHPEEKEFVKLLDFGIAKQPPQGTETQITKAGFTVGTPEYIAPEQALARAVDGRTDLYSAGVIFYEMIVGKRPFSGESALSVVTAQVSQAPMAPRKAAPHAKIPKVVEKIVLKTLAKDPSERFQEAEYLVSAIQESVFGPQDVSQTIDTSLTLSGTTLQGDITPEITLHPTTPSWLKPAFYLLCALSILLVTTLSYFVFSSSSTESPPTQQEQISNNIPETKEAEEKLRNNNSDAAIRLLQPLQKQMPQAPHIRTLLAEAYARQGNWTEARAHTEVARAFDPAFSGEEALVDLALEDIPKKGQRAELAKSFLLSGYGEIAIPLLERALNKGESKKQVAIAILGELANEHPAAIALLSRALNEEETCEGQILLVKALGQAPKGNAVAHGQLAAQKWRDSDCKGFQKILENSLKALQDSP